MFYLLLAVLLVLLLGVTAIKQAAWWLFIVLPTTAYTVWQFSEAWHSSAYFWYAVATVAFIVVASIDVARKNGERATRGEKPMSNDEIRRSMWGGK
jgi:hypothetical protein